MSKFPSTDQGSATRVENTSNEGANGTSAVNDVTTNSTGVPRIEYNEDHLRDLREVLSPPKLRLLQQILATEWGSLTLVNSHTETQS